MESDTPKSQLIPKKSNYVIRLFNGDIPLPITYWIFGCFIPSFLFTIVYRSIESHFVDLVGTRSGNWFISGFLYFLTAYFIFILIAVWRSAGKHKGKAIWAISARVAVVLGAFTVIGFWGSGFTQNNNTDLALSNTVYLMNKGLPKMIDEETRLDNVSVQGRDFYLNFTLVKRSAEDFDVEKFTSIMAPKLKKNQCAEKDMLTLLNEGRKIIINYCDKSNKLITSIIIEKSDCL